MLFLLLEPASMAQYARSLLEKNSYTFQCPHTDKKPCGKIWDWFLVRHVACLSTDELKVYEKKLSDNYAKMAMGVRKCPGCSSLCLRNKKSDKVVNCPVCQKDKKPSFAFCWCCLHFTTTRTCQNLACDGMDPRAKILATCLSTKMQYTDIEVPSIRACPGCGILITHMSGCKTMHCSGCNCSFCFVCLKKASDGSLPCGSYNTKCTPAPRQTDVY